jgi:hypothetical protein
MGMVVTYQLAGSFAHDFHIVAASDYAVFGLTIRASAIRGVLRRHLSATLPRPAAARCAVPTKGIVCNRSLRHVLRKRRGRLPIWNHSLAVRRRRESAATISKPTLANG